MLLVTRSALLACRFDRCESCEYHRRHVQQRDSLRDLYGGHSLDLPHESSHVLRLLPDLAFFHRITCLSARDLPRPRFGVFEVGVECLFFPTADKTTNGSNSVDFSRLRAFFAPKMRFLVLTHAVPFAIGVSVTQNIAWVLDNRLNMWNAYLYTVTILVVLYTSFARSASRAALSSSRYLANASLKSL